jgi:hypothetical protein
MTDVAVEQVDHLSVFQERTRSVFRAHADLSSVLQSVVAAIHNLENMHITELRQRDDPPEISKTIDEAIEYVMGRDYQFGQSGSLCPSVTMNHQTDNQITFDVRTMLRIISEPVQADADLNTFRSNSYRMTMPWKVFYSILEEIGVLKADGSIDIQSYPASNEWRSKLRVQYPFADEQNRNNKAATAFVLENIEKIKARIGNVEEGRRQYELRQLRELMAKYPAEVKAKPKKVKKA